MKLNKWVMKVVNFFKRKPKIISVQIISHRVLDNGDTAIRLIGLDNRGAVYHSNNFKWELFMEPLDEACRESGK